MFVIGNFIVALAKIIDLVLNIYIWVIIFRAVISWVNADPYNPIVNFLYRATEPVLRPIRRLLPFGGTGIDLSPLIVILIIYFLQFFLVRTMIQAAVYFN
ncbi:MAG TPA: YggT family protein [Syntrophales bacterium]|jgi:YggT family protein|nr:YggT family protein [Syntrophales bacterium]HON22676.1 YggT family protein [Syntrophales bacterium]HOU77408.1 YggT family protein [Syntrophales bacterium]HPC33484.1 YggT family protein [Syntrophales bacterium]HQG35183.1 YggT family protein [Syntrophales bacterium]